MPSDGVDSKRRRFLIAATSVVGAVGAGFAAVPFIESWKPSAKAQAVGAPVQVSLHGLKHGQLLKVQWRGQTMGILHRTEEMLGHLPEIEDYLRDPESAESEQPEYVKNEYRAVKSEFLVLNMHCTHLGCIPQLVPEVGPQPFEEHWVGGFFCPCHKSRFDLAGRVYKGVPAPTNLRIPPYSYLDDSTVIIGVDPEGAV